jgi:hypothetical protein
MRYMMLVYTREDELARANAAEMGQIRAGHLAVMEDARRQGILEAAEPLEPTGTATTVRVQNGQPIASDGPFAETKEQLAGYYILDCRDLDEAIRWAARIPTGCGGGHGCIEIRPFRSMPVPAAS